MLIISFSQIYTCCAFYQPKANLFCSKWRVWCDSRVILSNKKLELPQLATTWCVARQVWTWLVKCATSLFNSFCSKVAKQVVARLTVQVVALGKDWIVLYFYITYIILIASNFTCMRTVTVWYSANQVRRSAAKCLSAVLGSRPELLSEFYKSVSPALIARFKGTIVSQ